MIIQFTKNCGHRVKGSVLECKHEAAAQYKAGGFAVDYVEPEPVVEPVVEPEAPPAPKPTPKKTAKPKAKKE